MRIGEYNRKVAIKTNTPTRNGYGDILDSWATSSTRWAKIKNLTGGKLEAAQQIDIEASVEVRVRYCGTGGVAGLTVANQLTYNSRTFKIVHVNDVYEQHTELILTCKEQIDV